MNERGMNPREVRRSRTREAGRSIQRIKAEMAYLKYIGIGDLELRHRKKGTLEILRAWFKRMTGPRAKA